MRTMKDKDFKALVASLAEEHAVDKRWLCEQFKAKAEAYRMEKAEDAVNRLVKYKGGPELAELAQAAERTLQAKEENGDGNRRKEKTRAKKGDK